MDALAGLTFREPRLLGLLFVAVIVALWLIQRERLRTALAARFASERLRGRTNGLRAWRPLAIAAAIILAIIALAGPQLGAQIVPVETTQSNRIFLLDVSNSMEANDVGTTRFSAAKSLVQQLLSGMIGRVGLIVFERDAEIVSPLTTDTQAVASLIETLGTAETEHAGSDIGGAIFRAMSIGDLAPDQPLDLILVSDGEEQGGGRLEQALAAAKKRGARIHTIVVGSDAGSIIPTNRGPLQDEDGKQVVTRAHPEVMKEIADATGGRFFDNPFSTGTLAELRDVLSTARGGKMAREMRIPIERYEFPLGAAFVLFLAAGVLNRGAE